MNPSRDVDLCDPGPQTVSGQEGLHGETLSQQNTKKVYDPLLVLSLLGPSMLREHPMWPNLRGRNCFTHLTERAAAQANIAQPGKSAVMSAAGDL